MFLFLIIKICYIDVNDFKNYINYKFLNLIILIVYINGYIC